MTHSQGPVPIGDDAALGAVLPAPASQVEMRQMSVGAPAKGEVVVDVQFGGICGTDIHLAAGHLTIPTPLVLGHEGLGVIRAADPDAVLVDGETARVGQRVMWASSISCGRCWHCRVAHEPTLCADRRTYGVNRPAATSRGPAGSWSTRMLLECGTAIVPMPEEVDSVDAMAFACAGPTILHALDERRPVREGETVVVQGSGPVGMAAAAYAMLGGAARVTLVGAPETRLSLAAELGIGDEHIDFREMTQEELVEAVRSKTPQGGGADLVIECTGVPAAVDAGMLMCRRGGSYLVVGQYTDAGPALINPHSIVFRQLDVRGSWAFTGAHLERYVLSLPRLTRRHALRRLVSVFALAEAERAMDAVARGTCVKAVLAPEAP
jgi:threonine dehydrogenase-like Zn-dependent dehydrogenase